MASASNDEIEVRLAQIWQRVLGIDSITVDQNFFDLGGESSIAVQMFAQIEEVFKTKLPLATLYDAPTIAELTAILRGEIAESRWSPLVEIQSSGSRPPFFCIHGAGGNVLIYRDLARQLGPDQPFYGLQSVGLDGSGPPLTKVEEMAERYVLEIRRVQRNGPYFLGGYCLGGTIAYEVAQQLTAAGEEIALLAMFDTSNWHKVPLNLYTKTSHSVQQVYFHLAGVRSLQSAGRARFLREKIAVLRSRVPVWWGTFLSHLGEKPHQASSHELLLAHIWKVNDQAAWDYIPRPYPGEVVDIRPKKQYRVFSKPDLKWDTLARGGQKTVVLPVYPGTMLVEPFVQYLADALKMQLETAVRMNR